MTLHKDVVEALSPVSTATITTVLLKKGLRRVWMRGARPIRAHQARTVGAAFTLRFVPAREDLATPASWASPRSTRAAIEDMPEGCIAVADAMGVTDAGIFGDILCARMKKRAVAGLVTDGVVRDIAGVLSTGLPVWCQGAAAPPSVAGLTFVSWQEPIACGGVAVFPDDIIVVDDDGAVLRFPKPGRGGREGGARAGTAGGLDHERGGRWRRPSRPADPQTKRTSSATIGRRGKADSCCGALSQRWRGTRPQATRGGRPRFADPTVEAVSTERTAPETRNNSQERDIRCARCASWTKPPGPGSPPTAPSSERSRQARLARKTRSACST